MSAPPAVLARYQVLRARQRARELGRPASLTPAEWRAILGRHGYACAYCGAARRLVLSHIIPLEAGGDSTPENVVPACRRCHARKLRGELTIAGLGDATAVPRDVTHLWDNFRGRCGAEDGPLTTSLPDVTCISCREDI